MKRTGQPDGKVYCFGDCRFIPDRQLLMFGDNPLRVGTRALDLLHILLIRAGEVVSKDELISFVWPNTFVHESNLKVTVAALRRALPRTEPGRSCIATISGRGYRFVAPLRVYGGDDSRHPPVAAEIPDQRLPELAEVIGREIAIADLSARLPEHRFLTVVGPAGVGKTTVAIAVAKHLMERYRDGVCLIDLTVIGDPQLVESTIAGSLGVPGKWTNTLAGIVEALRGREMLLVLDNCEHVLSTASAVGEHLTLALPELHILATSREPLRSRSENVYRLSPLPFPDQEWDKDQTDALAYPAIALFAKRAGEACGYQLDDADAPLVAAICRRLDGIALAIELAASRLPASNPASLLGLLEQSFESLRSSSGTIPPRHQTLYATLDWSYQLLSRDEARLLRLLSVFSGSFVLSDVIEVAGTVGLSVEEIAACVESLAAKSLLSVSFQAGTQRYRLLDSTRSFAAERLGRVGEAADARSSHARYFLRLFEQAEADWRWQPRSEWTAAHEPRTNDLRNAIDWAFGDGADPEVGVRLTSAAIPLWDELSTVAESRRRVERALRSAEAVSRCDPAVRMKLIASYASGLNFSDRLGPEADAVWLDAHRLARAIGNVDYQLRSLWGLGILQSFTGRHQQAIATLGQFAQLADQDDGRSASAEGDRVRLTAIFYCGDVRRAHDGLTKLAREHAPDVKRSGVARFQMDRFVSIRVALATVAWVAGDRSEARAVLQDAVGQSIALGHMVSHSNALAQAALPLSLWAGEIETARRHVATLARNLTLREIAIWRPVCDFYEGAVRSMEGDAGGIDAMCMAIGQLVANNFLVRVPFYLAMLAEAALHHKRVALARDSLSAAFDRADRQGEHWSRPELLRVRGLLQWLDGDLTGASEAFLLATETARESGARFFQLRAAASLAELCAQTDRRGAAADPLFSLCDEIHDSSSRANVGRARHLREIVPRRDTGAD